MTDSPSVEHLMRLISKLSGYGDTCTKVQVGYRAATVRLSQNETTTDNKDWGFVVSTTLCNGPTVSGQAKKLEDALMDLAGKICSLRSDVARASNAKLTSAHNAYKVFVVEWEL